MLSPQQPAVILPPCSLPVTVLGHCARCPCAPCCSLPRAHCFLHRRRTRCVLPASRHRCPSVATTSPPSWLGTLSTSSADLSCTMTGGQAANRPPPPKSVASASIHSTALPCYPPTCHGAASAPSQPRRGARAVWLRTAGEQTGSVIHICPMLFFISTPLRNRIRPFSLHPPYIRSSLRPLRECSSISWCSFRFRIPSSSSCPFLLLLCFSHHLPRPHN